MALVLSYINPWSSSISKYSEVWLSSLYFKKSTLMSPKMKTSFPLLFSLSNCSLRVSRKY